ncbi:MAG: hypothetical protein HC815_28360 [Richelia sp. RM1_1_1]|nr:hypothetical protein [Richelia sp. RM1_1_1]
MNNSMGNFGSSYYRTRNGKRSYVSKSRNRLRLKASKGKARISGRISIPVDSGEAYALAAGSLNRDRRNIKEQFQPGITKRGLGIRAQGNLGNYQVRGRAYAGYND